MALARIHTFVPSATLSASQLENEFDNILNQLNGTQTSAEIVIKTSVGAASLTVNQMTGAQHAQDWQISGATKCSVNDVGQFESVLTTGTAPLVVASTTKVANLNADLLDGVEATGFVTKDFAGPFVLTTGQANPYLKMVAGSGTVAYGLQSPAAETYRWILDDADDQIKWQHYYAAAWGDVFQVIGAGGSKRLGDHNGDEYAIKDYVDAKLTTFAFGAFYTGEPTTAAKQARFVIPSNVESCSVLKIAYVIGVAGTGTTTIRLEQFNSAGVSQATRDTDITAAKSADTSYEDDIADLSLSASDYLVWTVTDDTGTHQDISIWAHGVQEVI